MRTGEALEAYEGAGMVQDLADREAARTALVDGWAAAREADPQATHVMLAHTRAHVPEQKQLVREEMCRAGGGLGSRGPCRRA